MRAFFLLRVIPGGRRWFIRRGVHGTPKVVRARYFGTRGLVAVDQTHFFLSRPSCTGSLGSIPPIPTFPTPPLGDG